MADVAEALAAAATGVVPEMVSPGLPDVAGSGVVDARVIEQAWRTGRPGRLSVLAELVMLSRAGTGEPMSG
jgi:hypothetical protein